jgi:hypothetical protein
VLQQCAAGDFNGDGKGDLACHTTNDSWQMLLSDGVTPDLLAGSTTIFGGVTSFQYAHAATMPLSSVPVPIDVVTGSTTEDGTGRKAVTTISYNNGYYSDPQHDIRG